MRDREMPGKAFRNTETAALPVAGDRLTLTAATLDATDVVLNGRPLRLGTDDAVPDLAGLSVPAGQAEFAPVSVTFVTLPSANNAVCR